MVSFCPTADEANVGSVWAIGRLDGIAANGSFANAPVFCINVDFSRSFRICSRNIDRFVIVVLDVVSGDLQVSNLATLDANTSEPAVADVIAANDGLVQVAVVEKNTYPSVLIKVAIADHEIACSIDDMDGMSHFADEDATERRLHDTFETDTIRRRMSAGDF